MIKKLIIICSLFCFLLGSAIAQRVKYKELFVLLGAKKYDDAEPFLRKFLKDPKNSDEANAHFQMGFLFEYKAEKNDLLEQNEALVSNSDSAIPLISN